jgi:hypothetical protein
VQPDFEELPLAQAQGSMNAVFLRHRIGRSILRADPLKMGNNHAPSSD